MVSQNTKKNVLRFCKGSDQHAIAAIIKYSIYHNYKQLPEREAVFASGIIIHRIE